MQHLFDKFYHFSPLYQRTLLFSFIGFGLLSLSGITFAVVSRGVGSPEIYTPVGNTGMSVLAAESENPNFLFNINVPSFFNENAEFEKNVTVKGNLTVEGEASFPQGINLENTNLDLGEGEITASNIVYSLSGGTGVTITTGQTPTITNSDKGSSQKIFKTISVSGQSDIAAGSNTDTLTFAAGSGITLTTDATNKKLTISGGGSESQWDTNGTAINYADGNVGIGSTAPAAKLDVAGSIAVNGTQIVDSSRNLSNVGSINSNLTPGANNTYDLGSSTNQWNNIYGENLYLAGNLITSGATGSASLATFTSSGSAVLKIGTNDVFFGGRTTMKVDNTNLANTIDVFAYDTAKDLDGGKWVSSDKVQSTSWYTETVDHDNDTCNIGTDDRCGAAAFPKKASLIVTSTALSIFDSTDNTLWMKFTRGTGQALAGSSVTLTSVYALNGVIYLGTSTNGLVAIDLINDQIYQYDYNGGSGGRAKFKGSIAARNTNTGFGPRDSWGQISADKVNGVTARILRGKLHVVASTLTGVSVINVTDHRVVRYIDN